ncbi:MAG: hypothetical protein N3A58_00945 [Spirochaetes bacterium]|nr:hypothetical protein [Spirochaetota bacterium]
MKKGIRFLVFIILILLIVLPVLAQQQGSNKYQHFVFRLKICQLSRYGAKIQYFTYTGYVKTIYIPSSFVNKLLFIKIDPNTPYSFMHVVLNEGKVWRIHIYLPNIMVNEYSTMDLSEEEIKKIQEVKEVQIYF